MEEIKGFYTKKNLLRSFWASLAVTILAWALTGTSSIGLLFFLVVLTLCGPALMAREAVIREFEENEFDR